MHPSRRLFRLLRGFRLYLPVLLLAAAPALAAPTARHPASSHKLPAGEALVLGDGGYTMLPPLPGCLRSAHAVAAALRRRHFMVLEQDDGSGRAIRAALTRFMQRLRQNAKSPAVLYACGYVTAFQDQPLLLPASITPGPPSSLVPQTVAADTMLDTMKTGHVGASLALFDVVPMPGSPPDLRLSTLPLLNLPERLGLLAVVEQPDGATPTPLATALIAALQAQPPLMLDAALNDLQHRLAQSSANVAAVGLPVASGVLVATPAIARRHAAGRPVG